MKIVAVGSPIAAGDRKVYSARSKAVTSFVAAGSKVGAASEAPD